MALNTEGAVYSGAVTLGNIPDVYMKYDMDKIGKLMVIARGSTRYLQYIQHKFGLKSKRVNTFRPRVQAVDELPHYIVPYEDSDTTVAGTTNTRLKVLNKYGKACVKQNDILAIADLFYEVGNTTKYSTTFGLSGGEYYLKNELVMVIAVTEPDAAGAGYSYIDLRRGWASSYTYPSYSDASLSAAPSAPPAITTTMKLFKSGNAFAHGTGAPSGDFALPWIDGNYLQEMKWAVEVTNEMELEKTWMHDSGYTILTLSEKLQAVKMMHEYESWVLHSQKTYSADGKGNPIFTSMGQLPFIKADTDHVIDYSRGGSVPTINYMDLNTMGDSVAAIGGGDTKTMVFGNTLLTKFQNAFFNKYMFTNVEMTGEFHIPVYKIETAGITLEILATYGMGERGWTDKALVWDFSVPFDKLTFSGEKSIVAGNGSTTKVIADFDLYVQDNIQLPGEQIHKKGYITIAGFQPICQPYHCVITGLGLPVAKYTIESQL
jgi:hypothetical protein